MLNADMTHPLVYSSSRFEPRGTSLILGEGNKTTSRKIDFSFDGFPAISSDRFLF